MKKILSIIMLLAISTPYIVKAEEIDLTTNAKSAVMIDYNTGEVLYDKNKDEKRSVASLTKMMGLILIFEKMDKGIIKKEEYITVSKNAKEMGGTQIWLEEGEKIKVDDLLKGITLASANDAMVLMAEKVSGTEAKFVENMNNKAKELGLKNTHFTNCTGFDEEDNYSSAYDMALIAKELLKHKKVLEYTSKYEEYIRENTDKKMWIVNTNKLVKFYKGVDGLKTGYETNAGSTLAVTAKKNNLRLIVVTLGYSNTNDRNSEAMKLLDYGFNQYKAQILIKKNQKLKKINPTKGNKQFYLTVTKDITVLNKIGEEKKNYTYDIKLNNIKYPIKKSQKIGNLYLKNNNKIIGTYNITSNKNIEKAGMIKQYINVIRDITSGNT